MRIESEFQKFLCSDEPLEFLQEQSQAARTFIEIPAVSRLSEQSEALLEQGDIHGIDGLISSFLTGDLSFLKDYIKAHLGRAASDSRVLPPFREAIEPETALFYNVTMARTRTIGVTMSCVSEADLAQTQERSSKQRVQFSGQKIFYKFLAATDLVLRLWECDPFDDSSDMNLLRCRQAREIVVNSSDILEVDGTRHSLSFVSCSGRALFAQVENRMADVGSSLIFDSGTGGFVAARPTDRTALRKMVMCSALRHLDADAQLADLPEAVRAGPFYQRWHFVRETVAAIPQVRVPLLKATIRSDPNASVRRAAQATLDFLAQRGEA